MLRLITLGGLELERDGQPVGCVANRKVPLALLALLAGHTEHGISRDKLMAYLWPESSEARARNSLKQALFALRHELGDTLLTAGCPVLRLDPHSILCDVAAFDATVAAGDHAAAAELYRGPFLDGFFVEDRAELERWVERERQRLHACYLNALIHLAKQAEAAPDPVAATHWWRRVVAAAPSSTLAALGVMRALAASGDRAAALEHARIHQATLEVDLGLPPDEAIREFAESLRRSIPHRQPIRGQEAAAAAFEPPPLVAAMVSPGPVAVPLGAHRATTVSWGAYLVPLILVLASAGAVSAVWGHHLEPVVPDDPVPAPVTVLPFETLGEAKGGELGLGLDALLSSGLDGLAEFRTVPTVPKRGAQGAAAALTGSAASAIARHSGARLYITGRLVADQDSLRATAFLRDRANADRLVARAEAQAGRGDLFALADQLVRGLVADRAQGPGERLTRVAAMSTRSLAALRSFLEGDRRLRADDYSAAIDAYNLAVRADTAFGVGYYQLSVAADHAGRDEKAMWAARLAARYSERLSEHDRRLVTAYLTARTGSLDEAERLYRGILTDYPEDGEAWLQLGELLLHGNPLRGRSAREAREPFERVLELDPGQGDALVHLARVASIEGRRAEVDSLVARAEALAPAQGALDLRAVRSFALNDRPGRDRATRDLLAQPALVPRRLALDVAVHQDDLAGTTRFAEILAAAPGTCDVRALGQRMLGQVAQAQGQMRSARHHFEEAKACQATTALELHALMVAQPFVNPPESELIKLRRGLDTLAETTMEPSVRTYYAALIAIRMGDTLGGARAARVLQHTRDSTAAAALARTLGHSLRARLLLARRQTAAALAELEGAEWERTARFSVAEASDRFLRAELLRALGRTDEAIGWYGSIAERASYELVYLAPAELRLARIYDGRGDTAAARAHYGRFVELWRNADPELQPPVVQAEARMATLSDRD